MASYGDTQSKAVPVPKDLRLKLEVVNQGEIKLLGKADKLAYYPKLVKLGMKGIVVGWCWPNW